MVYLLLCIFIFFPHVLSGVVFWHHEPERWEDNFFKDYQFDQTSRGYDLSGEGINIAIVDSELANQDHNQALCCSNFDKEKKIGKFLKNTPIRNENKTIDEFVAGDQKDSSCAMKKNRFFSHQSKKITHATCTVQCIQKIAPRANIHVISVLDSQGNCSKQRLLEGLQKVASMKIQILYLGVQIFDFNTDHYIDRSIDRILSKLAKSMLIIAPTGNFGNIKNGNHFISSIAYPACKKQIVSVGALQVDQQRYLIAPFCQKDNNRKIDFLMPGANISCMHYYDHMKEPEIIYVSGTSLSGAFIVGSAAIILQKIQERKGNVVMLNKKQFMREVFGCCKMLDSSWSTFVNYGIFNLDHVLKKVHARYGLHDYTN